MSEPVVVVRTAPRKIPHLEETLRQIDEAGAASWPLKQKIVLADGGTNIVVPRGWTLFVTGPGSNSIGARRAGWKAMEIAVALKAPWALHFPDDIILCKNAFEFMKRIDVPDNLAWLSFFDHQHKGKGSLVSVYDLAPRPKGNRRFMGGLALKITMSMMKHLLAQTSVFRSIPGIHYYEVALARASSKSGGPTTYGLVCPNVIDHVGMISGCHPGHERRRWKSATYPGNDFDAMTIL